jgi:16S rRNA (cytosine1402-N4)-methyltransferase
LRPIKTCRIVEEGVSVTSHMSVLPEQVVEHLDPKSDRTYVDGTLGRAGHAEIILDRASPNGRLIGIDRDLEALEAARVRLERFGDRVILVHGRFGEIASLLDQLGAGPVDGMLLDLGVSSPQLDVAGRGFSFSKEGPLDMRMDPSTGRTALELIDELTAPELERVLRDLGEERYAGRLSRAIKDAARRGELRTTTDLARLVARSMPRGASRHERIDPATRTFQALRIAVNDELGELDRFLEVFPDHLRAGGRCVVISFHSLEDRKVKERFRELEWTSRLPPDLAAAAGERTVPVCRVLTRKPVVPDEAETARNPRARSAKLRACEKVGP